MKRCSTCGRTYTDPNLSFCIDDGTPLTAVVSDNVAAYQPPGSYVPPGTEIRRRRRVWPWVLGIVGAFILGIAAIGIAVAILAPRFVASQDSNSNSSETPDTPPPTDHNQVLAQLTAIENDWTVANINADKNKLGRILADDYAGQASDGGLQSKAQYIRAIQRDTQVVRWEFGDLKLTLTGDRATLNGRITYVMTENQPVYDFTDKFVWRDGRWQATGSEVMRREEAQENVNHQ